MYRKLELIAARVVLVGVAIVAGASLLSGCAAIEKQIGGQVLGASVTLAGVTVALSGTIPTAKTETPIASSPAPAAPASAP